MDTRIVHKSPLTLFGHHKSLPLDIYVDKYPPIRCAKLIVFAHCFSQFQRTKDMTRAELYKYILPLELGCLQVAYQKATEEFIKPAWHDEDFVALYSDLCYKVSSNLDPNNSVGNRWLVDQILDGHIAPENCARMSSIELFPDANASLIEHKDKSLEATCTVKTSVMFRCTCGERNVTILYSWAASLDESNKHRVKCNKCGKEWNQ